MVGSYRRRLFILVIIVLSTCLLLLNSNKPTTRQEEIRATKFIKFSGNTSRNLSLNEINKLSNLGKILFINAPYPPSASNKTYEILVWKYGKSIENRHLKNFGNTQVDPFEHCSVKNCKVTYKDEALKTADIVIFHMHRMKFQDLPKRMDVNQIWTFLTDESPHHTFLSPQKLTQYNGVFNWSMTYRMDADIPVPYGRTIPRTEQLTDDELLLDKKRDVLVAILGSNCGGVNKRWDYVRELQKHIKVDVYGGCGPLKCPGHFKADCPVIKNYLFYLAFENSNCDEYITEKLWWNAFSKNAIPVVMGASRSSYAKLLPPSSYLNVDDYAQPKDLAMHILYLNSTQRYLDYYQWKLDYQILNEHGYFQSRSYHYCRICEALNYNEKKTKVYSDLSKFWDISRDCHPAWNA